MRDVLQSRIGISSGLLHAQVGIIDDVGAIVAITEHARRNSTLFNFPVDRVIGWEMDS